MQTDAHFIIGQTHAAAGLPCQDYALTGQVTGGTFAIVADGCSSGGRTDVGARLVTQATDQALRFSPQAVVPARQVLMQASQRMLNLNRTDMLATCLYAQTHDDDVTVHVQGDGVVALGRADGQILAGLFEWSRNAPAYPSYADDGFAAFKAFYGDEPNPLTLEWWSVTPTGAEYLDTVRFGLDEAVRGITLDYRLAGLDRVAVFTDGVTQIDGVDWTDAVRSLLAFKTRQGAFARRRMNRFVRDVSLTGRGPLDDLAYAVIITEGTDHDA